jgi:AcrR family transcriptional regulator
VKNKLNSAERMMVAAVHLFARSGYHGTTTKEVSELANVSESNIFRYFPTKRDLFLRAIEHELKKVTGCADALVLALNTNDANSALSSVFELISEIMVEQPELVRLLHFSAMEFGTDMEPLFRRHVQPSVEFLSNSIRRWSHDGQLSEIDPRLTVLSFIATGMFLQDLFPAFSGSMSPFKVNQITISSNAAQWRGVLVTQPTTSGSAPKHPTQDPDASDTAFPSIHSTFPEEASSSTSVPASSSSQARLSRWAISGKS